MEVQRLCAELGLVRAGKVSLDGTKMKAPRWPPIARRRFRAI